jgi:GntR family transcriptional regulator/MocR family aminotransferase
MSLDDRDRVIYMGSFSKVMFPALRLAFVVLPSALIAPVLATMRDTGPRASIVCQPVLARFMAHGTLATHIRRMRRLYARRQATLLDAIEVHAAGTLDATPAPAGMHLIARMRGRMSDREAAARAAEAGITAPALSSYFVGDDREQGLVLGYAGYDDQAIDRGVRVLARALANE